MRAETDKAADTPAPVLAQPDTPGQVSHTAEPQIAAEGAGTSADMPAQAQTGTEPFVRKLEVISRDEGFLRDQISQKDVQIAELNEQMRRKDDHISAMLERDKETNVLIHRLQDAMSRTLGVTKTDQSAHRLHEGDSAQGDDLADRV